MVLSPNFIENESVTLVTEMNTNQAELLPLTEQVDQDRGGGRLEPEGGVHDSEACAVRGMSSTSILIHLCREREELRLESYLSPRPLNRFPYSLVIIPSQIHARMRFTHS